jgi:hypothetical protein
VYAAADFAAFTAGVLTLTTAACVGVVNEGQWGAVADWAVGCKLCGAGVRAILNVCFAELS